jgi:hypothetical protein
MVMGSAARHNPSNDKTRQHNAKIPRTTGTIQKELQLNHHGQSTNPLTIYQQTNHHKPQQYQTISNTTSIRIAYGSFDLIGCIHTPSTLANGVKNPIASIDPIAKYPPQTSTTENAHRTQSSTKLKKPI